MFKSILLPIDLASEASWRKPLELAIELTRDGACVLHVMSVLPDFGMSVVGSYFDKDFEGSALEALVAFGGDNVLHFEEFGVSLLLYFVRDGVGEFFVCAGPGTR